MTDPAGSGSRFDPRFDPAFQPGYDPTSDARPEPGGPQPRDTNVVTPMPGTMPAPTDAHSIGSPEIHDIEVAEPAHETVGDTRLINPFLIAIWLLSAVFIASGLLLLRYMGERLDTLNSTGGGSSADYYILNSYATGAPLLVVLGLATATGSLFLLARRRSRATG